MAPGVTIPTNKLKSRPPGRFPAGTVLVKHFDLPIDGHVRGRFEAFLRRSTRGGYAVHHYEPAEFGLDLALIRQRFEPYERAMASFAAQGVAA